MALKIINNFVLKSGVKLSDHKILKRLLKIAGRSTCLRAKVGCILVKKNKILLETNNNTLPKFDCSKIGCIRDIKKVPSGLNREICYGLCAEQYLLSYAAKKGISVRGGTIYVTTHPCRICECLIAAAGIKRVVYVRGYPDVLAQFDPLRKYGIEVIDASEYDILPKPGDV
ncbi:MAG: deoxycytidylate deaminase, dCMP deaminase [Candidatus Peregrinibacteria bacterium GW2011_GWE2_39_6]|nr:MAG: deoxycytidylate deaminase, dCMP deaminase [Candidatus Peregrinibacteria bacterium GW2011_GWF2_39_17]KKR26422.1 MAG: deoxycytidylate deaminase, dCMP deaminase [Candidatus Peregrinibacteria bacterium GW2011_GWE2_39_6]HCW32174.1 deoxycytidylate deaminase [Candidatus Peregrinibacteria bacterium]